MLLTEECIRKNEFVIYTWDYISRSMNSTIFDINSLCEFHNIRKAMIFECAECIRISINNSIRTNLRDTANKRI